MEIKWQTKTFLVILGIFLLLGLISYPSFSEEEKNWNHVAFSSQQGAIKFFDRETGTVYSYSPSTGKLTEVWHLEELGENLRKGKKGSRRR
ncbi:MAG: hypothetical protein SV775_09835 [Thermodesulfobacteriota bacterium]|nr:hypothetical protein [Thermodesulfobacteriota bacterium]